MPPSPSIAIDWLKSSAAYFPVAASNPAVTFAMNRKGPTYTADHSIEETADVLARACGHWGTGAEYLMHTVAHLEDLGIHDRYLWRLQEMVAARIEAAHRGAASIAAS